MRNTVNAPRKRSKRLTERTVRRLLDEWGSSDATFAAFCTARGFVARSVYYAIERLKLTDHYYTCREAWQCCFDVGVVQEAMSVVRQAIAQGDAQTARWLLERRVPIVWGQPEFQLLMIERAAANNGHLQGYMDPKIVGCPLPATQDAGDSSLLTAAPIPANGNGSH